MEDEASLVCTETSSTTHTLHNQPEEQLRKQPTPSISGIRNILDCVKYYMQFLMSSLYTVACGKQIGSYMTPVLVLWVQTTIINHYNFLQLLGANYRTAYSWQQVATYQGITSMLKQWQRPLYTVCWWAVKCYQIHNHNLPKTLLPFLDTNLRQN